MNKYPKTMTRSYKLERTRWRKSRNKGTEITVGKTWWEFTVRGVTQRYKRADEEEGD